MSDSGPDGCQRESLRERRRRETREALHAAALRLAREVGFEQVTVEMISREAGVSPRTFFNYFPSKESALLIFPASLSAEETARFVSAPGRDADTVLRDLGELLAGHLGEIGLEREEFEEVFRIAEQTPSVLAGLLARFDAFEQDLSGLIARRIGREPGGERPDLLAGVCMTALRIGMKRWVQDPGYAPSAAQSVRHSFAALRSMAAAR